MSAYIVDNQHIAYLVAAAMSRSITGGSSFSWYGPERRELSPGDFERAAEVANMLLCENIKSVSCRYPHESSATLPGPKEHSPLTAWDFTYGHWDRFEPEQLLKACDCLEYQSCEHDGWENSEASAFLQALRRAAWYALPGYKAAEWGAPKRSSSTSVSLSSLIPRRR